MAAETLELVASADWVEERRDELAGLANLGSGADISDRQQELQFTLAQAAGGIMEELPHVSPQRTRKRQSVNDSLLRLGANVVTQHQTRSLPVRYEPTMAGDPSPATLNRSPEDAFGCYARAVSIEDAVFQKRLFVPLFAGDLALKDRLHEVNYVGIESGGDPYITPGPLDIDFSHAFRLVRTDGGGVFPRRAGAREHVADLIEGLHALAASATADPADRHLHVNPLRAFENM